LLDPHRAAHILRDVYRRCLEQNPDKFEGIRRVRPEGPLAISHVNAGRFRRYDFILTTPDIDVINAVYHTDLLPLYATPGLSDHAPVVATIQIGRPS
jgi:hypothetical protein